MEPETIKWGFNIEEPKSVRSLEHQQFLIKEYNKNKPLDEQISTVFELIELLKKEKKNEKSNSNN